MFQILLETVPYRQWIIVTPLASPPLLYCTVPYTSSKIRVLVLQSTIPTVLPYRNYYGTYSTVLRFPLLTTYYLLPITYYGYLLLPNTYYQATTYSTTSCLLYCLLPITCYILNTTYYLIPTTCYLLPATYYLLPTTYYLLPATYYLLPTTYCLLPTPYYLLPTMIPAIPTYYLLYLLPTTYYLLASTDRRRLQLGSWPSLLGRVPPLQ